MISFCFFVYTFPHKNSFLKEGLTGQFNLMLARSGLLVYTNLDDVTYDEIAAAIESGVAKEYEGAIE